ncbi:MAG: hypothetical protein DHS20C11_26670 [Lysobacteraceae bacterium]|nr:MAG: hypothetical protein DHS20C11_26670 [Xanthomonadaceae bacterium]
MLKLLLLTLMSQVGTGAPLELSVARITTPSADIQDLHIAMSPNDDHWQMTARGRVEAPGGSADWEFRCDQLHLRSISRCRHWQLKSPWSNLVVEGRALLIDTTQAITRVEVSEVTLSGEVGTAPSIVGAVRFNGQLELGSSSRSQIDIVDLSFDSADGLTAAAAVAGLLTVQLTESQLDAKWQPTGGEVLAHPLYFSFAPPLLHFDVGYDLDSQRLNVAVAQDQDFSVSAELNDQLDLVALLGSGDLAALTGRFLEYFLSTEGWGDLSVTGRYQVDASLLGEGWHGRVELADVDVRDEQQRAKIDGLNVVAERSGVSEELAVSWAAAAVHDLPVGPMALQLARDDQGLRLLDPLQIPILDGLLTISSLSESPSGDGVLAEASLDALSMPQLAETLGWPTMAGELTADIPSVLISPSVIAIDGQLTIDVFDGRIAVERMQLERPFGVLPAMSADVTISQLDLERLTGKFGFGQISGRLDGFVRNLRLLDWEPAEFDAFIEVPVDGRFDREISQQAVENLASVSGTPYEFTQPLLAIFDSFKYRRLGLGCTLRNDVCSMRGVGQRDNGYFLLEGRGLPRIDIVGYSRQVNWPELLKRIMAAIETGDVRVGMRASLPGSVVISADLSAGMTEVGAD